MMLWLTEEKSATLRNTLADVMSEALINALPNTLAEVEAKTIGRTLRDLEAEALVDTTADTLPERRVRKIPTY